MHFENWQISTSQRENILRGFVFDCVQSFQNSLSQCKKWNLTFKSTKGWAPPMDHLWYTGCQKWWDTSLVSLYHIWLNCGWKLLIHIQTAVAHRVFWIWTFFSLSVFRIYVRTNTMHFYFEMFLFLFCRLLKCISMCLI